MWAVEILSVNKPRFCHTHVNNTLHLPWFPMIELHIEDPGAIGAEEHKVSWVSCYGHEKTSRTRDQIYGRNL